MSIEDDESNLEVLGSEQDLPSADSAEEAREEVYEGNILTYPLSYYHHQYLNGIDLSWLNVCMGGLWPAFG
jgi:hypothetical protein